MNCIVCKDKKIEQYFRDAHSTNEISLNEYRQISQRSIEMITGLLEKHPLDNSNDASVGVSEIYGSSALHLLLNSDDCKHIRAKIEEDRITRSRWISYVRSCPSCSRDDLLQAYCLKSKNEIVDTNLIERLHKEGFIQPKIYELSQSKKIKSCIFYGATGIGKSVLLKYNYNRIYRKDKTAEHLFYGDENHLRPIFENDIKFEEFIHSLEKKKYFFIEELFSQVNWKDLGGSTDRAHANSASRNMFRFYEYLDNRRTDVIAQATTNNDVGEFITGMLGEEGEKTKRRILDFFKEEIRL